MDDRRYVLDIEIYDAWGDGHWAQARFLVHGIDDVLWTNSVDAAFQFLRRQLNDVAGEHQHRWDVMSTAVATGQIIVECYCGAQGVIDDPSPMEWGRAYYAPSSAYRWDGGDERVKEADGG